MDTSSDNGKLNSDEPLIGVMRKTRGNNKEIAPEEAAMDRGVEINAEKNFGGESHKYPGPKELSRSQTELKGL